MDVAQQVAAIDAEIRDAGRPERAEAERRYLKSTLVHYGVRVPALRTTARAFLRAHPDLGHDELVDVVTLLWDEPAAAPVHERRFLATVLLSSRLKLLGPSDLVLLERLLRESRTWALLDLLAADVGSALLDDQPWADEVLDRWAADGDFWIRRSALLAHLRPLGAGRGDLARFLRYADAMLDEREFFIRKAIGWVLRATSRQRPDVVHDWLLPRAHRASGVTVREAVRYLSPADRDAILAAYRR